MAENLCQLKKKGGGSGDSNDYFILNIANNHLTVINCAKDGHSKYTTSLSLTVDGVTFSYSSSKYTSSVAGTYKYTTSAVYNGEVSTSEKHANANEQVTLSNVILALVSFIPD